MLSLADAWQWVLWLSPRSTTLLDGGAGPDNEEARLVRERRSFTMGEPL